MSLWTRTGLRCYLRSGGCLRPRDHLKGMEIRNRLARCHKAHPPTHEDEESETQRWFIVMPPATRHLLANRAGWAYWHGDRRSKPLRTQKGDVKLSPPIPEVNYVSERAITYRRDLERAIPFSSEREPWEGVRDDI